MGNCVQCGNQMEERLSGRRKKYCSSICEGLFKRKLPIPQTCQGCGVSLDQQLKAGRPRSYCSRKCASDLRTRKLTAARRVPKLCAVCGSEFIFSNKSKKYCSEECRLVMNRQLAHERWNVEKATRPATKSWVCQWCGGEIIVHISYTGHGKFHAECRKQADRVQNRIKTLRRQKVRTGLKITHEELAERDNFVCHICGETVDMSLPRTSKLGATIDHVVPITRGGRDELDNLKLAHWVCNVRKNNKLMEELNV